MAHEHPAEANVWAMHRDFARIPGAVVHDEEDLLWFTAPTPNSWLNGASWARLASDHVERRVDEVTSSILGLGHAFLWHVTPSSEPPGLSAVLERRGFERDSSLSMVLDMSTLVDATVPKELVVDAASTDEDVHEWCDVFDRAMVGIEPRGEAHPWRGPFAALAVPAGAPCRLFTGRVDGEPVGTALGFVGGGAVGVYAVATEERYRARGYGTALTRAVLGWGRARGERTAVLQATEVGRPVYAAMGFEPVWEHVEWRGVPDQLG